MSRHETELEIAESLVREGELRIARQKVTIKKLEDSGGAFVYDAQLMLQALEHIQQKHVADLERLMASK
ncbi:hypothetical protein [Mesorhizobium hawassense]|nr:hypothetical protein [Mesorhizobium hawassense]